MEITLTANNNAPIFCVRNASELLCRIFGAVYDKHSRTCLFPAFHPFLSRVLADIDVVAPQAVFTPAALHHIQTTKTYDTWRHEVSLMQFPTKSGEHQLDALAEVLTNYRWFLRWGMGVGKTKIILDAIQVLGLPTLVLCPKVAIPNWISQAEEHSGGALVAHAIHGGGKQEKLQALNSAPGSKLVVATYDTARNYGHPTLAPAVIAEFRDTRTPLNRLVRQALSRIVDPTTQMRLARAYLRGQSVSEVCREATDHVGTSLQFLIDLPYQMIVCDESHRIKNISSAQTSATLALSSKAARRVNMSGTAIQGDPRDAFAQLKFLAPYVIPGDYRKFCLNYVTYHGKMAVAFKNLHMLNKIINDIGSQRTIKDCVTLPPQTFITIPYTLSSPQRTAYNTAITDWVIERSALKQTQISNSATRISKLLQICSGFVYVPVDTGVCDDCAQLTDCLCEYIQPGSVRCVRRTEIGVIQREALTFSDNPKLDALSDLLEDMVSDNSDNKVIIWATFTQEIDMIEKLLKTKKLDYVRIDSTTSKVFAERVTRFNTDPTCKVYLAHISTGISITLNAAQYMVYYSRDWSLDHRNQSSARNYRIGQTQATFVYDLCALATVEHRQLTALKTKEDISTLLTNRVDCMLCTRYVQCQELNIMPWTDDCKLTPEVTRVVAKAVVLKEGA